MTGPVRVYAVDGYLELRWVAHVFQVDPDLIRRRLRAKNRSVYPHPADARVRLLRDQDIREVFALTPVPPRGRETARHD